LSRNKLIKKLKEKNPDLTKQELETVINTFSESISSSLKKGNPVEIRGFGRWFLKKLKQNFNSRNPATNEKIYKPERLKVRFKASKKLNKLINE
tara:strand:- start:786 stop:1067 length:282 start_codon:yes stop_codon:yes gene_type:complete